MTRHIREVLALLVVTAGEDLLSADHFQLRLIAVLDRSQTDRLQLGHLRQLAL